MKNYDDEFFEEIKNKSEKKKNNKIESLKRYLDWKCFLIFILILVIELEIYESLTIVKDFFAVESSFNPIVIMQDILKDSPATGILLILISLVLSTIIRIGLSKRKTTTKEDERGFEIDETNKAGASRFLTDEEKRKLFDYIKPDRRPEGNIIAVDKKTKELMTVPFEIEKSAFSNRNIALFGPPGMRKTSGVLIPNIYSNILAGNSVVCSDPKGELYKETYAAAKYFGYNVRVFNILGTQFQNSDGWDCLKSVRESEQPSTTAQMFASTLLKNVGGGGGDKPFWSDANKNFLTLIILYVAKAQSFIPITVEADGKLGNNESLPYEKYRTIREVYALITTETEALKSKIREALQNPDDKDLLESMYNVWSTHREADSVKSSLGTALNFLQSKEVNDILSTDDIDFHEIANDKTIVYVVCADNDQTFKPILTLFMTFMFREVTRIADEMIGSTLKRPLFVILEEAGNIGEIPYMSNYVSTVRSRNIGMMFCFQTLGQMMDIYGASVEGKHEYETILAGCPLQLCLGANDATTQKYFSEKSGTISRVDTKEAEERNKIFSEKIQKVTHLEKRIMTGTTARATLLPDEISKIKKDEILIVPATDNITIESKYYYKNHPLYNIYLKDMITGEEIAEHLTKHHMPKWKVEKETEEIKENIKTLERKIPKAQTEEEKAEYQEDIATHMKTLSTLIDDDERYESVVGKRPVLFGDEYEIVKGNRSFSNFHKE